jgi:hypothetical protein
MGGNPVAGKVQEPAQGEQDHRLVYDTVEFLTTLSQNMADENDQIVGLMRRALSTLKGLAGIPDMNHNLDTIAEEDEESEEIVNPVQTAPADYDTLEQDLMQTVNTLQDMLERPDYVPIEELEERDAEISQLRQTNDVLYEEWRKALNLVEEWNKGIMTSTGADLFDNEGGEGEKTEKSDEAMEGMDAVEDKIPGAYPKRKQRKSRGVQQMEMVEEGEEEEEGEQDEQQEQPEEPWSVKSRRRVSAYIPEDNERTPLPPTPSARTPYRISLKSLATPGKAGPKVVSESEDTPATGPRSFAHKPQNVPTPKQNSDPSANAPPPEQEFEMAAPEVELEEPVPQQTPVTRPRRNTRSRRSDPVATLEPEVELQLGEEEEQQVEAEEQLEQGEEQEEEREQEEQGVEEEQEQEDQGVEEEQEVEAEMQEKEVQEEEIQEEEVEEEEVQEDHEEQADEHHDDEHHDDVLPSSEPEVLEEQPSEPVAEDAEEVEEAEGDHEAALEAEPTYIEIPNQARKIPLNYVPSSPGLPRATGSDPTRFSDHLPLPSSESDFMPSVGPTPSKRSTKTARTPAKSVLNAVKAKPVPSPAFKRSTKIPRTPPPQEPEPESGDELSREPEMTPQPTRGRRKSARTAGDETTVTVAGDKRKRQSRASAATEDEAEAATTEVEEAPKPKSRRKSKAAQLAEEAEETAAPSPKKTRRKSRAAAQDEGSVTLTDVTGDTEVPTSKPRASRRKSKAAPAEDVDATVADAEEDPVPKAKATRRKSKAASSETVIDLTESLAVVKPKSTRRKSKAATVAEDEVTVPTEDAAPLPKPKSRRKSKAVSVSEPIDSLAPRIRQSSENMEDVIVVAQDEETQTGSKRRRSEKGVSNQSNHM